MNKKFVILGLGKQGEAALYDIVKNNDADKIIVIDNRPDLYQYLERYPSDRITGQKFDIRNEEKLFPVLKDADMVIEALPGPFAFSTGRLAAKLGVNLVSSMYYIDPSEEDPEKIQNRKHEIQGINKQAKEKGVTILTEFGLDPGIDLILGKKALSEVDQLDEFHSYGAGLPDPDSADNPLNYKFTWSPIGVMRAYNRPSTIIRGGQTVIIDGKKMFEPDNCHFLEIEELGTNFECYPNGNSLHYAEVFGIRDTIKEMGRYTCRFPGHCAFWEKMAKCGFLDEEPVQVGNLTVSPVQFTASLLASQKQFQLADNEQDITLLVVDVKGKREGQNKHIRYQLIDRRDMETGFTSMQRTVGFTMALGARLILEGKIKQKGLLSPIDVPYELVIPELAKYGILISRQEIPWE
ncbi:saccharopine dehydrogenase family protein [candidate division KSB1 bacterium]